MEIYVLAPGCHKYREKLTIRWRRNFEASQGKWTNTRKNIFNYLFNYYFNFIIIYHSQVYKSSVWLVLWFLSRVDFWNVHSLVGQLPDPTNIYCLTPLTMAPKLKNMGRHLGFLVGRRHQVCMSLLIIHVLGLLRQISIGFVWVECYSWWATPKNLIICQIKIISQV